MEAAERGGLQYLEPFYSLSAVIQKGRMIMPSLHELLQKADSYKEKISSARPLAKEEVKSLDNYFRIGFTYTSNAL